MTPMPVAPFDTWWAETLKGPPVKALEARFPGIMTDFRGIAEAFYDAGLAAGEAAERERCAARIEELGGLMAPDVLADRIRAG